MSRLRPHALSIFFAVLFVAALGGQSAVGLHAFNNEQAVHGEALVTYGQFLTSSAFVVDVAENWQSEYLQFFLFIAATIWFVQRGSQESKQPGAEGMSTDKQELVGAHATPSSPTLARVGGWRTSLYSNSLLLVMAAIFLASWTIQSLAGRVTFNAERAAHGEPEFSWLQYVTGADFWNRTLQNWQSEFLAVGCMIAFSIYLRQRGSPESKPVGAAHGDTDVARG